MFVLYVIYTSEEDVVVREEPGVRGGAVSVIRLLKVLILYGFRVASYLIYRLRFRAMEGWDW